jgi:hypothetical protein
VPNARHKRNKEMICGVSGLQLTDGVEPAREVLQSAFEPNTDNKHVRLNFVTGGLTLQPSKGVATNALIDLEEDDEEPASDHGRAAPVCVDAFKISGISSVPMLRQQLHDPYKSPQSSLTQGEVPKIIVTPPIALRTARERVLTEHFPRRHLDFDTDREAATASAHSDENYSPDAHVQKIRAAEDHQGMSRFKTVVDAFLSEFFIDRSPEYIQSMILRFVELLNSSFDPNGSCDFRNTKRQQQIPSLCALCTVHHGVTFTVVHHDWVRQKLKEQTTMVVEHIVTGMIALVVE